MIKNESIHVTKNESSDYINDIYSLLAWLQAALEAPISAVLGKVSCQVLDDEKDIPCLL